MNRQATKAALRSIAPAVVFAMLGCDLPSKTVGNESETDGDDAATDDGVDDGASSMDGPSVSVGSEDDGGVWEPCAGLSCGEHCYECDPDDPECALPGTITVCMPDATCDIVPDWNVDPCPGTGVESGFEAALTQQGGCSDMLVYAADEGATIAMHIAVQGLVQELHDAGMPILRELAADDPAIDLYVTSGSELLAETCTDVLGTEPVVNELWRPAQAEGGDAGTIAIELELVDDQAFATVTLTNVNLRRADFEGLDPDIVVSSLVIPDVHVGWLPG